MTQPSHAHNIAGEIACFVGTNVLKLDHMPSVGVQTDQLSNVKTNASINNEAASRVHVLARKNDLRTAPLTSTMKQPSHPPNSAREITQASTIEQRRQVHALARTPI